MRGMSRATQRAPSIGKSFQVATLTVPEKQGSGPILPMGAQKPDETHVHCASFERPVKLLYVPPGQGRATDAPRGQKQPRLHARQLVAWRAGW